MGVETGTGEEFGNDSERIIRNLLEGRYFVFHHQGKDERDDEHDYHMLLQYEQGELVKLEIIGHPEGDPANEYNVIVTPGSFARHLAKTNIKEVFSSARLPKSLADKFGFSEENYDSSPLDDEYNYSSSTPAEFEGNLGFELRKQGIVHRYL